MEGKRDAMRSAMLSDAPRLSVVTAEVTSAIPPITAVLRYWGGDQ